MARDFVAASSQKLKIGSAVLSTLPMSFACWFKPVADGVLYTLMSIDDNVNQGYIMGWNGGSNSVRIHINGTLTAANGVSTGGGVWYHCGAQLTSSTARNTSFNGVLQSQNTTSVSPSAVSQTQVGVRFASSNFVNGTIAEAAIWNVALAAGDWAALYGGGSGISPLLVRPDALVAYWPLIGHSSPEIDLRGRNELTVTGASQVAHPRIMYPPQVRQLKMRFVAAAVGGGKLVEGGALINSSLIRGGRLVA